MTDEEKAPYQAKYTTDRERFLKEKEVEDKKTGKVKDPTKPKRPQSGYFLFLADFRKIMAGKTLEGGEKIPSLAGEKWRDMGAEEKRKYELLVEQDKLRYEREMEEWRKTNPAEPVSRWRKPAVKKAMVVEPEPVETSSDDDVFPTLLIIILNCSPVCLFNICAPGLHRKLWSGIFSRHAHLAYQVYPGSIVE